MLADRRRQLSAYRRKRDALIELFRRCANGQITWEGFYTDLPQYWSYDVGDRLQWRGWERTGKGSDFQALSESFLKIIDAPEDKRDDVTVEEIDRLAQLNVPTRGAFLSEMLCLRFPKLFPVVNKPIKDYLTHIRFLTPSGASEGAAYLDLAQKLRVSLLQTQNYPAKNLAELDAVIWHAHHT